MIIAEELDLPVDKVRVTLAPARPELLFNQLTGGSNTMESMFTPIRVAAAVARGALLEAAAIELGSTLSALVAKGGVITGPGGASRTYGELAAKAASATTRPVTVTLKPTSQFSVIGTGQGRVDARDIVTGKKQFAMDLAVPGALPTMICRPPTLNGTPKQIRNLAKVKAMPGVTDVVMVDTGVAVRAATFGQCIDAIRTLRCDWNRRHRRGEVGRHDPRRAQGGRDPPGRAQGAGPREDRSTCGFEFMFRSSAALEPNCAIADVRGSTATVWAGLKSPIVAQKNIADALGLLQTQRHRQRRHRWRVLRPQALR